MSGSVTLRFVSASPAEIIEKLIEKNIAIHNIKYIDHMTVELSVGKNMEKCTAHFICKRGGKVIGSMNSGIAAILASSIRRPVFMVTIALLIFLSVFLSGRLYFFK
jgi:hypothetical protein